jgi:hypothetical protein
VSKMLTPTSGNILKFIVNNSVDALKAKGKVRMEMELELGMVLWVMFFMEAEMI